MPPRTLSEKLRYLLVQVTNREGQHYNYSSLAKEVSRWCPTTHTTIRNLVGGIAREVSARRLFGLAKAFGVTIDYFDDDAQPEVLERTHLQLTVLERIKAGDIQLEEVIARAHALDHDSLDAVLAILRHMVQVDACDDSPSINAGASRVRDPGTLVHVPKC